MEIPSRFLIYILSLFLNPLKIHKEKRIATVTVRTFALNLPRFFNPLLGFGYPDETLFLVFDVLHRGFICGREEIRHVLCNLMLCNFLFII